MKSMQKRIPKLDDFFQIRKNDKGEEQVFVEPKLALILDSLGSRMFQSAKMSMFQGMGVQAKLDKGLKTAFAKDIVDKKIPILSIIGDFAGINVKQYIAKNPDAFLNLLADPRVQKFANNFMQGQNKAQGSLP